MVSSSGLRSDYSKEAEIASCLPPDLRHLLSSYKGTDSSTYGTNKVIFKLNTVQCETYSMMVSYNFNLQNTLNE